MIAEFDRRRKVVVDGLNKLPGVSCITPKGAFYAFPNIKGTGWKAKELANALLDEAGVATIGGPDFGILGEGYMRLSYANSTENIVKALDRMSDFLGESEGGLRALARLPQRRIDRIVAERPLEREHDAVTARSCSKCGFQPVTRRDLEQRQPVTQSAT